MQANTPLPPTVSPVPPVTPTPTPLPPTATPPTATPTPPVPPELPDIVNSVTKLLYEHQMHEYQSKMRDFIVSHPFCNLFTFLGSGKTIATLSAFKVLREMGLAYRMLVIAPKSVCQLVWEDEVRKWSHLNNQNWRFSVMLGTSKQRQRALFANADIYMINFEGLFWLTEQLERYFITQGRPLPFDMLVLDEASKMKNTTSKRFKRFIGVLGYFSRRVSLTASPASNGLVDVFGINYCTDLGQRLGSVFNSFLSRFFVQTGARGKWLPHDEDETRNMIINAISDITLVLLAEGNINLPPLSEEIRWVTLPPKLMSEYIKLETEFALSTEADDGMEVFNEASLANKLLQFSSGRVYYYPEPENQDIREVIKVHDLKYEELDRIYKESGDEPIFLMYGFGSEREEIMKRYPDAECLVGASSEDIRDMRDRFNDGKIKLLLTHPASSGYGLNLQGSCRTVVIFTTGYSQEQLEQGIGRIFRQGQAKSVRLYWILTHDTRDEIVHDLFISKTLTQNKLKDALVELQKRLGIQA